MDVIEQSKNSLQTLHKLARSMNDPKEMEGPVAQVQASFLVWYFLNGLDAADCC